MRYPFYTGLLYCSIFASIEARGSYFFFSWTEGKAMKEPRAKVLRSESLIERKRRRSLNALFPASSSSITALGLYRPIPQVQHITVAGRPKSFAIPKALSWVSFRRIAAGQLTLNTGRCFWKSQWEFSLEKYLHSKYRGLDSRSLEHKLCMQNSLWA